MKIKQFLAVSLTLVSCAVQSQTLLNLETGAVKNAYNTVRIPGDDGTRFNLRESYGGSQAYYRIDLKHTFGESDHGARLLYAPLSFSGEQKFSKSVDFNGSEFAADTKTDTLYKFSSYRVSYYYQVLDTSQWKVLAGFSAKVRDANIELEQNGLKESRSDLGVVPLAYFWARKNWESGFNMTFDFDGLIGPQGGRAFDAALAGGYQVIDNLGGNLGVRMLEGGVDNDKVYNFAQFNYYFVSLDYGF